MVLKNEERIRENVKHAATEDLLDRATVYRAGMEPEAVAMVEEEQEERGISAGEVADHAQRNANVIWLSDGTAKMCSLCRRPAIVEGWRWRELREARFLGLLLFWLPIPWFYSYCEEHTPPDWVT